MFKNMRLGAKIVTGFTLLILIAVLLGGLAVWNMRTVKVESTKLSREYVPEVREATEIERSSLQTMYNMRGYALSQEEHYLRAGRDNLQAVRSHVQDAAELADASQHLVKLQGSVDEITAQVDVYEKLAEETVVKNEAIARNRTVLDEAASAYMTNCGDFVDGQNEKMRSEFQDGADANALDERLRKITLGNDVIDLGNAIRVATWKAQAQRDPELLREVDDRFTDVETTLDNLQKITRLWKRISGGSNRCARRLRPIVRRSIACGTTGSRSRS